VALSLIHWTVVLRQRTWEEARSSGLLIFVTWFERIDLDHLEDCEATEPMTPLEGQSE